MCQVISQFVKSSRLVEEMIERYEDNIISEVSVIFNIKHIRSSLFGKFVKPLLTVIKGDGLKERIENPDYFFNIPESLTAIIEDMKDTYKYLVITIDCSNKKVYKDKEDNEYVYYDKSISVIRNPKLIEDIEEIQKKSIIINEYTF